MEKFDISKNSNSNKFDKDIIQKQSYKIINEDTLLKNSISNNKNSPVYNNINKPKKELTNTNYNNNDEDDNINMNININNYLSKQNINKKSDSNKNYSNSFKNNQKLKKPKILLKKNNTAKNKGYLLPNSYNNLNINNKIRNLNSKKDSNDIMKSRLLARIRKQKEGLKNFDYKLQNINNNKYSINNKKNEGILLSKKEEKDENGKNQKNEKEESKHIPKILTFLRTFKNFALPLKGNNDKKDNNNNPNTNSIINNNKKDNESNYLINPNNSCFNFSSKLKPNIAKLNLNKRNLDNINNKFRTDNNENENCDGNEGEDFIDYNRFTFRNNIGDDDDNNTPFKTFNNINNEDSNSNNSLDNNNNSEYNNKKDNFDSDLNQIINIDEYNRRNNNYNNNQNNNNQKYIKNIKSENNIIKNYKNKNVKLEEISSNFINIKKINKNLLQKNIANNNNIKPYLRKKYLKNKYNSPKPEPKNKVKNNNTLTYNNILKKNNNLNINIQSFDNYNYGNENDNYNSNNEDSIQSLNISRSYRKPILNTSFQRNNNFNKISKTNSYYNDISVDQINLSNNYNTLNRPIKNNKIHEIIINMNDSLDSFNNERNYYTNNNLYSNRSPLKRKDFNTINNNIYSKRSPLISKQNGGAFDLSDNYDTNQMIDDERNEIYNKRNTNYSRFMEPFQRNDNQKWYNEDSYYSFDIINMKKMAKNNNLLYQKPIKTGSNKIMNKNNSMYIKRVVHYDSKKNSILNDSDYMNDSDLNNYRNRLDYTDYDAREKNVFDFDAPKAIKDSIDDISNHNSEFINDSSRENQISINSDINTNKLNISENNNIQNNGDNSNVYIKKNNQSISNRGTHKMIYMKKLNTVYNFYQGTKKLFSKINDKVFKHKKEDDKNIIKNNNKIENNQNNNINNENNSSKKNDLLKYKNILTPGMKVENKIENNIPDFPKNTITPFGEDNNQNIQKEEIPINKKIHNNKNYFTSKYYNFYITKIKNDNNGTYFSKITTYKSYKVPNKLIYYMTKEKIDIFKIPLNNRCYFQKKYIITKEKVNIIVHQKIFSFFSLAGNENFNDNNNIMNEPIKEDENKKIMNLKQKLFTSDKQIDLLLSNDFNKNENIENNDRNSFSFKDNKNILYSNNISSNINDKNEINNFFFTLAPKTINNKFEIQKIVPEKNNNLSIINKKENKNKINKYDYNYILSFKNNKFSKDKNLLPQNVLEHFDNLNKETDNSLLSFSFKKNINNEENKNKKKFNKEEIQEILKKYFTPNKKEEIKKLINKNFMTENKKIKVNTNEKIKNNIDNSKNKDIKLKMEWARNDLSKEIEQAEIYIKELKNKMKENTKKNDIICLLNMLTVDNLNIILNKIIELLTKNNGEILPNKDIMENEYILIKVILDKAITEKRFVNLYAKLCFDLFKLLNDKIYNDINFKNILIEECKIKFNELNNINNSDNNSENNKINLDDEKYYFIKKKFLGNIDFICELINVNILPQDIGFYYLDELFKKYNNINSSNDIETFKKYLCLEAIVNFLSKFGKKINENKNINNVKNLNYFIDNNLNPVLETEKLPGFLKYKIINLIEKQKNQWKDSLYEKSILAKGKNNLNTSINKSHKLRKRIHSKKNIKSISPDNSLSLAKTNSLDNNNNNTQNFISSNININNNNEETIKLIEKDLENYETFLKDNNITNKSELDNKSQIGNEYDWSMIEDILSKNNIDLGEVIRCYVEVCIDQVVNNAKIFVANDYIKNIINYYSTNLTNKEIDIIHNKMINLFRNIQDICIDNYNMKEIMGYLLFILIENKLNFIKDLNNFIGMDKEIIITIAEVIKFAIISSQSKSKKYHNDFKQTKLFVDNSIFNEYVTTKIQDL